jgi:hypothetical protein
VELLTNKALRSEIIINAKEFLRREFSLGVRVEEFEVAIGGKLNE